MVRLPAGTWPAHSRQALTVWVLGPHAAGTPREERRVAIADLRGMRLDAVAVQDVVTDVMAALADRPAAAAHAFRFARLVPTSDVQAARGPLVSTAPPAQRPRHSPAELALTVQERAARASAPVPPLSLDVSHGEFTGVHTMTLDALVRAGALRVIPGNRIAPEHVQRIGDADVLGPEEVLDARARGARGIDRLTFAATYPSGRYTEPGDVVMCAGPAAMVDDDGFSVVAYPARILRLVPHERFGLTPHHLVHEVLRAPSPTAWRTWPVRVLPPEQVAPVEAVLTGVAALRADLSARLAALDDAASALVEGVTAGGLTLNHPTDPDDVPSKQRG